MNNQIPFAFDIPSVSELTADIKSLIETRFRDILVEGELSNVKESRNGHIYFTIKDDHAQLPCVIWRSTAARLDTPINDGQQVVLGGDLQVYPPHGKYQMIVTLVQQAGLGRLQQKFEMLKLKLEKEGLFKQEHKKPLPPFPLKVGVITSSTGAAFHDIRATFEKRWPIATLYLHHASVQGNSAAGEISEALQYFNSQENPVDLIIVGRGGGSLEDLWSFNEEAVARAIFNSEIPVVSAVGHEVDFSISDFVADERAATPTQSVIISTPDINEVRYLVDDLTTSLESTLQQKIKYYKEYVYGLAHSHALLVVSDKLRFFKNRTESVTEQLQSRFSRRMYEKESVMKQAQSELEARNPATVLGRKKENIASLSDKLNSRFERRLHLKSAMLNKKIARLKERNPKAPLERGFTRVLQDGVWVRSKKAYQTRKSISIEWQDGIVERN
jgi:exodeoxyribonuclease VII large subunit